jgi:hypothetical protein
MKQGRQLAEAIRAACLEAAVAAYEDAGISGLCGEGRWECALQAIKALDLDPIIERALPLQRSSSPAP